MASRPGDEGLGHALHAPLGQTRDGPTRQPPPVGGHQPVEGPGRVHAAQIAAQMPEQIAGVADAGVDVHEAEELGLEGRVGHGLGEDAALHGPSGHVRGGRLGRSALDRGLVESACRSRGCEARGQVEIGPRSARPGARGLPAPELAARHRSPAGSRAGHGRSRRVELELFVGLVAGLHFDRGLLGSPAACRRTVPRRRVDGRSSGGGSPAGDPVTSGGSSPSGRSGDMAYSPLYSR